MQSTRRSLALAFTIAAVIGGSARAAVPVPVHAAAVRDWLARNAVSVSGEEVVPGSAEARVIDTLIQGSRVFAFGEPTHSAHQPLVARNRLIRYLVRITASRR